MGSMDEEYTKSQRRIQAARKCQQKCEVGSTSYQEYERIILHEMAVWN